MPDVANAPRESITSALARTEAAGEVGRWADSWLESQGDYAAGRHHAVVLTCGVWLRRVKDPAVPAPTQILLTFPYTSVRPILDDVLGNATRTPMCDFPDSAMTVVKSRPVSFIGAPHQPATVVLRDLMRWTGDSPELLAETLGASRRSIYNWLKGKPVRSEFAKRAERLQLVLSPLRDSWHPGAVSAWLRAGSPCPADFAAQEQWIELQERVRDALRPLQPEPDSDDAVSTPFEPWSAAAVIAVLDEFNSPPPAPARRRPGWRPRELTGSTPEPDDE